MPRRLRLLPVPAGPDALRALPALRAALDGSGPAVLPYAADAPPPGLGRAGVLTDVGLTHGGLPDDAAGELPDDLAVVVGTSGSSAAPKRALLTASALHASAQATADRLSGHGDWLLALPAHHIAGLQVLLRAAVGGGSVRVLRPGPFTAAAFAEATASLRSTPGGPIARPAYVSLVPTQLARLLADEEGRRAAATYDAVLVGGAACPIELVAAARAAGVRVVPTYGSSETCGGCVYDGLPLACADVTLESVNAGGGAAPAADPGTTPDPETTAEGRIWLAGPMLATGYLGDPARTAEAFVVRAGRRWYRTDDLGRLTPDPVTGAPRLSVLARVDDVIVTGGLKVTPRVVEDAVRPLLPTGWDVIAVGVPDEQWGQAVAVAIGPTGAPTGREWGSTPGLEGLRESLRGSLAAAALPRRLAVLDQLPTLGIGKPDRGAVRRTFDETGLTE